MSLWQKNLLALTLSAFWAAGLFPLCANAEGFPGKGDPSDWSDALPYYNLANKYLSKDRYEDAIEKYQEAIARYPYDADFFSNLGVAYRKIDDYVSAEVAYKKAIDLNDKDWQSWSNLANAYLKQDRLLDTIATFKKALTLNPPPAEKAAMLQDIKDITKILRVQGKLPLEDAAKSGKPKALASKPSGKPSFENHAGAGQAKAATAAPVKQPPPQNLNGSGWDYIYK